MLHLGKLLKAKPKDREKMDLTPLHTAWGEEVAEFAAQNEAFIPRSEHPHPQCMRRSFRSLNGWWDCAIIPAGCFAPEDLALPTVFDQRILVPFSPETPLSGIGHQLQPDEAIVYRRRFDAPAGWQASQDCFLHFEAVDYRCAVYCNGALMQVHAGGYLPFAVDVTQVVKETDNELLVVVKDPSQTGAQLRGKQCLEQGDIWYSCQSGIWQPVWIEALPSVRIEEFTINGTDAGVVSVQASTLGGDGQEFTLVVSDTYGEEIGLVSASVVDGAVSLELTIPDVQLWSPEHPYLYHVLLNLGQDTIKSYCACRSVSVEAAGDGTVRFMLNGNPYFMKGVLDQGYWPESLMTASDIEAFTTDIKKMKSLGFNMMRKHIKIESDVFYYLCDKLGMLVWQDMVSGGGMPDPMTASYKPSLFAYSWRHYSDESPCHWEKLRSADEGYRAEWSATCAGAVSYLRNHPCIVTWVLFNEGWGQFESRKAADMVAALDPTRPIAATSGWYDQGAGSYCTTHNYFRDPTMRLFGDTRGTRAAVVSEFGGLVYRVDGHSACPTAYGYDVYDTQEGWKAAVRDLLDTMDALEGEGLSGYVYTQVCDIEEEDNGLLTYDRRVNKLA